MQKHVSEPKAAVTTCTFEASQGDYSVSMTVVNGIITSTGCNDSRNGGGTTKGESGFEQSYEQAIKFITRIKPEELPNMYKEITEPEVQQFLKKLRDEMIAKLTF